MVPDAFLGIMAICGVFYLCCIFHGQSALSAGRQRPAFCFVVVAQSVIRPAVCFSLVGLMYRIDILIVGYWHVCLYGYVPHRCIASAILAAFRAPLGTLRRPLARQRGGV
jgi:hypothetical protein